MKRFSIKEIPEFSQKKRIVVVGFIGKTPLQYTNKATPLLQAVETDENGIECHWDERNSILYLHAMTYFDTSQFLKYAAKLEDEDMSSDTEEDGTHWLVAAGDLAIESARIMGLVFSLSHIVVLSSPTTNFDLGYIQMLKAIDAFRIELSSKATDALNSAGLDGTWASHGRTCCPRLLFHFRKAPRLLKTRLASLKKLEHAVEDQLYYVLRKARIITNVCAKSLFAIPKNEEFVYISTDDDQYNARDVTSLVEGLVRLCNGKTAAPPGLARPNFKHFLKGHVDLANADGFDDNVGKFAQSTHFFELPSAEQWRAAAMALRVLYLTKVTQTDGGSTALYNALQTDLRFSQARCAKVLPIAQAAYNEGLPAHYSSQHHEHKLAVALSVLRVQARGPAQRSAARALRESCGAAHAARTLCEHASLTGHACVKPKHDSTVPHSSGVRYTSACNCGRSRAVREDPYTVRAANCDFYTGAARDCTGCDTLPSVDFPVFQPSTHQYRAASVKDSDAEDASQDDAEGTEVPPAEAHSSSSPVWSGEVEALSPGQGDDDEEETEEGHEFQILPIGGGRASGETSGHMSRQPSTTEYLPGMLHTASPLGLLPAFSSWALHQLGGSSLYSHSLGLPEHLQPGFLPNTNTLSPTDLPASHKPEPVSIWKSSHSSRGRGPKSSATHPSTVKLFIGYEYECPRGHRYMVSTSEAGTSGPPAPAPAGTAHGTAQGTAHGAAHGTAYGTAHVTAPGPASASMPLWWRCPCRGGACARGRLQRLHLVTPKCSQRVTINPRVQPIPGGPIFIPQPESEGVIKLAPSAYWILRFPYIYADEKGTLTNTLRGRVLANMCGITD